MRAVVVVAGRTPVSFDLRERVMPFLPFGDPDQVRVQHWTSADRTVELFAATNEPGGELITVDAHGHASSYVGQMDEPVSFVPDRHLHRETARRSGRFAAIAVDAAGHRVSAATSPSGADPLFIGESHDLTVIASWAAAAHSVITDRAGDIAYDPIAVASLVNNGFLVTRRTPFRGVRSLPPHSTALVSSGRSSLTSGLAEHISSQRPVDDPLLEQLEDAYIGAFRPMRSWDPPISSSLSGGKDSRLVLTGLLGQGLEVTTSTVDLGGTNRADVETAERVARAAGVPHTTRASSPGHGEDRRTVDVLSSTRRTLRLSEAMLHGDVQFNEPGPVRPRGVTLAGGGGELLRGGYGHGLFSPRLPPTPSFSRRALESRWNRHRDLLRADVADGVAHDIREALSTDGVDLSGAQVLDHAYVSFRNACWLSMSARAHSPTSTALYPACDNRLALAALASDAAQRSSEQVVHELMRRRSPKLARMPFAADEWSFDRSVRLRVRRLWQKRLQRRGQRMPTQAPNRDWRLRFHTSLREEFRHEILDGPGSEALFEIVDRDRVKRAIDDDSWGPPRDTQLAFNLYTAAVLLSGTWTDPSLPGRPREVRLAQA